MRDAIEDARAAGLRVELAELGQWSSATLISEYDRAGRTIRINADAVRRVREALGDAGADALVAAAVGHELYHHEVAEGRLAAAADRASDEREASRFARLQYGIDPQRFERVLL
jgi:hypothetical protein